MTAIDPKTYAQLASRVYDRKDIRNKMTLPQDFTELGWQDDDPLTGFSAGVYQNGNQIVISFTGTNEKQLKDFVVANIPSGAGFGSAQITRAAELVLEIMRQHPDAEISFTGHSLGGGLASIMAILFDKKAVVFDPEPFKAAVLNPFRLRELNGFLIKNGWQNSFRLPYECVPVVENIRKTA